MFPCFWSKCGDSKKKQKKLTCILEFCLSNNFVGSIIHTHRFFNIIEILYGQIVIREVFKVSFLILFGSPFSLSFSCAVAAILWGDVIDITICCSTSSGLSEHYFTSPAEIERGQEIGCDFLF